MKGVFVIIMFSLYSWSMNAQDNKYFKIDTPFVGSVKLIPYSNETRAYHVAPSPVYFGENYSEYMKNVLGLLISTISQSCWSEINEYDKEDLSIMIFFDKIGKIFKMELYMSNDIFNCITEEQWNEFCFKFKSINVYKYLYITDYDKKQFVYGLFTVKPYAYLKHDSKK